MDDRWRAVTLAHLLTMSMGLDWSDEEVDRLIDAEKTSPMVAVDRQPRGIQMDRVRRRKEKSVG